MCDLLQIWIWPFMLLMKPCKSLRYYIKFCNVRNIKMFSPAKARKIMCVFLSHCLWLYQWADWQIEAVNPVTQMPTWHVWEVGYFMLVPDSFCGLIVWSWLESFKCSSQFLFQVASLQKEFCLCDLRPYYSVNQRTVRRQWGHHVQKWSNLKHRAEIKEKN